jgi:hypothetical protein
MTTRSETLLGCAFHSESSRNLLMLARRGMVFSWFKFLNVIGGKRSDLTASTLKQGRDGF